MKSIFVKSKQLLLIFITACNAQSVPELCDGGTQTTCTCGSNGVETYVFQPNGYDRCIHTYIPESSSPLPVLISVSAYGQGTLYPASLAVKKARYHGFALFGIGSTGPFDGAGNFGLEFPANGVANPSNPTPCAETDSREYLYIKGVLDFIENHGLLDASKVYFEGFSQNSMFAAYASVCFADRVAGLWQGGSGLAKTYHTPLVPGLQAQCSASDFASLGNNCCAESFCTDCTWWPLYPRTCENKLVDCIASYTNDKIACGSDWYMYEAMVAEGNDARMLSFSPNSPTAPGGHQNPKNKYSWIVGCLGIVESCSTECETSFLNCMTTNGVDEYATCEDQLENGNLANCAGGCAPTLEMLKTSETPVINLSEGKFGTQSGLAKAETPQKPTCEVSFGSFDDVGFNNRCRPKAGEGPADGEIEACEGGVDCDDSPLLIKKGNSFVDCNWVARKPGKRCPKNNFSTHCPKTCSTCSICVDSAKKFIRKDITKIKTCDWFATSPEKRCLKNGANETCREACGLCS